MTKIAIAINAKAIKVNTPATFAVSEKKLLLSDLAGAAVAAGATVGVIVSVFT